MNQPDPGYVPGFSSGLYETSTSVYGPSQDSQFYPAEIPSDFMMQAAQALMASGVDTSAVPPGQQAEFIKLLWTDPVIQQAWRQASGATILNPGGATALISAVATEVFDPTQSHNFLLVAMGTDYLQRSGGILNAHQQAFRSSLGPGAGDSGVLGAIAQAAQENGVPYNLALAVAQAESGLDPGAIGDHGSSYGLFQLHEGGELTGCGLSPEEAHDPLTNARCALQEFARVANQDPSVRSDPGRWAALSQRPADASGYAGRVNNLLNSSFGGSPSSTVSKPFDGNYPVTQAYGENGEVGIDYGMPSGTPLYTPFAGTVHLEDGGHSNWGKRAMVKLDNGYSFNVGHMTSFSVFDGERINAGALLGESGGDPGDPSSGVTTGAHIEVQWQGPGGQYMDPNTIMGPILGGYATYNSLNLAGADSVQGGVGASSPMDRLRGIDPALEAKYPTAVSEFQKYFGRHPSASELQNLIQHGTTTEQLEAYLRTLPSHVPGVSLGAYQDIKGNLDAVSMKAYGHAGTDGMIKELYDQGLTSTSDIQYWLEQQGIAGKLDPKTYADVWKLNQPYMGGIYNQSGFDPRIAASQVARAREQNVPIAPVSTGPPPISGALVSGATPAEQKDIQDYVAGVF